MKIFKKILFVGLISGLLFIGCDSDSTSSGSSVGCANLKAGTRCNANKACSNHFLCLTGQGSDKNCSNGCSCQ